MEGIYEKLFTDTMRLTINFGDVLKLPLIVILIGNIFYSFMLVLKVKILIDTVDSENNRKIKALVYINLFVSLVVALLATFIILLG